MDGGARYASGDLPINGPFPNRVSNDWRFPLPGAANHIASFDCNMMNCWQR
jgi:hypothetical protein